MDCIFCKIIAGEIPAQFMGENEEAVAFKDINPASKVHILVVPRQHTKNISELTDTKVLAGVFSLAREVAARYTSGDFRIQINTGESEGQSVFHTHLHVLSGSPIGAA